MSTETWFIVANLWVTTALLMPKEHLGSWWACMAMASVCFVMTVITA